MITFQIYCKNGNDAESIRTKLYTLRAKNISLEEMPHDSDVTTSAPFFSTNTSTSNFFAGPGFGFGNAGIPISARDQDDVGQNRQVTHLLRAEIDEDHFEELVRFATQYDCYIERIE